MYDPVKARANLATHQLVKTGDPDAMGAIVDRNGEVVLGYCRRCHGGEAELEDQSCLERLVAMSIAHEKAMTSIQRAVSHAQARRSWVIGEMMLTYLDLRREDALARYNEMLPEGALLAEFESRNSAEHVAADGTVRKSHYGPGRQPWDDIMAAGWGAPFAASCVLRYLRRDKEPEHSIKSARWYYTRLNEMVAASRRVPMSWEGEVLAKLNHLLSDEEKARLVP